MNEKTMVGYHATDKDKIKKIIKEGFIKSKVDKGHWLGQGIYLFDNLYYAIEWEIIGVIKHNVDSYNQIEEKCGILTVEIDVENYKVIDFSEPQGYVIFEKLLQLIKKNYPKEKYEDIISKGYAYVIRVLENLEKQNNVKLISKYDVICAVYPKYLTKQRTHLPGDFIPCVQKQICVKNKEAIKTIYELKHCDLTKGIFRLISNNRREKND